MPILSQYVMSSSLYRDPYRFARFLPTHTPTVEDTYRPKSGNDFQSVSEISARPLPHIQRTQTIPGATLTLPAPFHQLHWKPLMCCIMKCSNE